MKFELFYPQWKDRAVTFSYDDGQIFDRRLVDIFNKYNLKATFHLNSGTLDTEGFIKTQELKSLYQGHEIACHGVAHEYPTHLSQERLVQEFYQDRCSLERETGRIIRGCSYAFGEYDQHSQKPGICIQQDSGVYRRFSHSERLYEMDTILSS